MGKKLGLAGTAFIAVGICIGLFVFLKLYLRGYYRFFDLWTDFVPSCQLAVICIFCGGVFKGLEALLEDRESAGAPQPPQDPE